MHRARGRSLDPRDATMQLADGRTLGWAEYGAPGGAAVVAHHGSPDSRIVWRLFDTAAAEHGLRLIAPDRPGFGLSDPRPGRVIADWPRDLEELADHLGLAAFPVLAISGGGAYAAAAAWRLADRVSGLGLFSVISPLDVPGVTAGTNLPVRLTYLIARRAPALLGPIARSFVALAVRNPERVATRIEATRPPADRDVLARPEVRRVLLANIPEQFRDAATVAHEFRLAASDWGVPLEEIRVPTHLWQGGRDDVHTPPMARYLAERIPTATLSFEPEFATFTYLDHLDPIMATLADWAR